MSKVPDRIFRAWLAGLICMWLVEIPVLALIGVCWGISEGAGEVIAAASVLPFLLPTFVLLICEFGGELLDALRSNGSTR